MINPNYLNLLRKIYMRLQNAPINWVVTGSLSFALQGVSVAPHDIDLQTDEAGAYAIEQYFVEYSSRKVVFASKDSIRSHLGALMIDGISVEIMGDIQHRGENGTWEAPVDLERYKRYVSVEDMQVPVLSLDYEYQAYTELGRLERAHMIKDALEQLQNRARE